MRDSNQLNDYINMRMGWPHWRDRYTVEVVDNLRTVLAHINSITEPFKLVVSGHWGTIYTNDVNLANEFVSVSAFDPNFASRTRLKQAVVDRPRDTVLLMDPKHSIRSYFKAQWFPGDKIPALREFFAAQEGAIVPSQAMQQFLRSRPAPHDHWFPNYYYVDYDDPRYATMLAMIMPRCFRKTMSVVQRINS